MKGIIFAIAAAATMLVFTGCADNSSKACVRPVYCVSHTTTGTETSPECWEDQSKRDTHVTKYKEADTYISQEDKCLDQ